MGYDLEPGRLLMGCIYLVHHQADLYPESHQFRLKRFLERQYSPCEFLLFGGGSRRWVRAALAMYKMTLILNTILNMCDLELVASQTVKPQRRGGTLAPSGGVWLKKVGDHQGQNSTLPLPLAEIVY